jgi:type II secretory pathway pseudopilin PulG
MRLFVDTLIALLLAGILASVVWAQRQQQEHEQQVAAVYKALADLYEQAAFHGAMRQVPIVETSGFPLHLSPLWFDDKLPINTFAPSRNPWLDVAKRGDRSTHPPDPVITSPTQAGFWYSPERKIFRARVTPQISEQQTLRLYNELNHSTLTDLTPSDDPDRQPQPNAPPTESQDAAAAGEKPVKPAKPGAPGARGAGR